MRADALAEVWTMLADGKGPAEAAAACRFADQSHLTRHFRNAFGVTPGKWAHSI